MTKKINLIARNFKVVKYNAWYFNVGVYDYSYYHGLVVGLYFIILRFLKRFFYVLLSYQINFYLNNFFLNLICYKNAGYLHNKAIFFHKNFTRSQKKKLYRLRFKYTKEKKFKYYLLRYFKEKKSFLKTQYLFHNLFKYILEDFLYKFIKKNFYIMLNNYLQLFQYIFSNKFFFLKSKAYLLTSTEAKSIYIYYLKYTNNFLIRLTYMRFKKFLKFIIYIFFGFFLSFKIHLLTHLLAYYLQKIKRHTMFILFFKEIFRALNNFNIKYYTIKIQLNGRINGVDRKQKYINYFGSTLDIAFSSQNYKIEILQHTALAFTPDGILNLKLTYYTL
jgi:hypothetical protein